MSKPEVRSALSAIAQNPITQRVATSVAADSIAKSTENNRPQQQISQPLSAVIGVNKKFDSWGCAAKTISAVAPTKPTIGTSSKSSALDDFSDLLSSIPPPQFQQTVYKKLTATDPFSFPPQLPTKHGPDPNKIIDIEYDVPPTAPIYYSFPPMDGMGTEKQPAPLRPPPPKFDSLFNTSLGLDLNYFDKNDSLTMPNAVAKYPCTINFYFSILFLKITSIFPKFDKFYNTKNKSEKHSTYPFPYTTDILFMRSHIFKYL